MELKDIYTDKALLALSKRLPDVAWDLLHLYVLLVLTKGTETTCRDVHDAWSLWKVRTLFEEDLHHSLVPFDELPEAVQKLDEPYRDAIHEVAKML